MQEYPKQVSMISPIIDELRAKANYDAKLLFLVSVNASGKLVHSLRALTSSNLSILVVCNTGDEINGVMTLSNIKDHIGRSERTVVVSNVGNLGNPT
jgi:predicted transcriptional regulator